ncbi:MAG TPA: trans-aconitate 2-methyltransferase [Mycobacterium sp.]|jgi:trans-aconitate 2-methyltransferase|nr:trans-aconitate 2-methyltransferase [Mycobacterium sp.]
MWNPDVYLAFADDRARPFFDLLSRVGAEAPRRVVDLGCGPGNLTSHLQERWPDAVVEALDSSPEMVRAARGRGIDARVGDVDAWQPPPDTDVVLSNAALQWVPTHRELLLRWTKQLPEGAWIAMQVPGNFDSPSHVAVRELAAKPQWATALGDFPFRADKVVDHPAEYAARLADAGCTVDAWETTYVHQLTGATPVLDWISGTALTAVQSRLPEEQFAQFREELIPMLGAAYPARSDGVTYFPFRRVFVVARVS